MKNTGIMFVREIALCSRRTKGAFGPLAQAVSLKWYFCAITPSEHVLVRGENGFLPKKAIYQTLPKVS